MKLARLVALFALACACACAPFGSSDTASFASDAGADGAPNIGGDGGNFPPSDGASPSGDGSALDDGGVRNNDGVLLQQAAYSNSTNGYSFHQSTRLGNLTMAIVAGRFAVGPHPPVTVSANGIEWSMVSGSSSAVALSVWIAPTSVGDIKAVSLNWGSTSPSNLVVLLAEWAANPNVTAQMANNVSSSMTVDPPPLKGSGSKPRAVIIDVAGVAAPGIPAGPDNGFTEIAAPVLAGDIGLLSAFRLVTGADAAVAARWTLTNAHANDAIALAFDVP